MDRLILQTIDPAGLIDSAKNVTPNDGSGYSFAVVVLTFVFLLSLWTLRKLWDENKVLQGSSLKRAVDMTESLISATNAQEKAFNRVAERLDDQAELLKEIKAYKK